MILVAAAVGLALLALPGLARPLGRRLEPGRWARLAAAGLLAGAALFELALVLAAAPPILRASDLVQLARACQRMLGALEPGGQWLGIAAALLAVLLPVAFWRAVAGARGVNRRMRVGAGLGAHRRLACGAELVVLPSEVPLVVSVPGEPGQIIVSDAVLASLDDTEVELVCRHESAHLRLRHARYLELAVAVERTFRVWPLARLSTRALRVALERWADEVAAGAGREPRSVLRDALLSVALAEVSNEIAALGGTGLLERIDALAGHPPRSSTASRWLFLVPGLSLGVLAAYSVSIWGHEAYCAVAMSGCMGS